MNKTLITTAIAAVLSSTSFSANALSNGDTLSIAPLGSEVTGCLLGTPLPCDDIRFETTGQVGSYFILGGGTTSLTGNDGIVLGTAQAASGSHSGLVDGSESPGIDLAWNFSSNTGMHQSTSAINVISDTEIDMAGWAVAWNGIAAIPMGGCGLVVDGCSDGVTNTGIATITVTGNTYVLDYFANVPLLDASGFGGAGYTLHLEGEVSAVPVPAAVWLFGSGLLGLVGVARRKKSA